MGSTHTLLVHPREDAERIEAALETADRSVTAVEAATEALARLGREEYDCVVCEHDLPGDDGLALLSAVNDLELDVPVLVFTGTDDEEVASAALGRGAERVLRKDGSGCLDELAEAVDAATRRDRPPAAGRDVSGREPGVEAIAHAVSEAPIGISLSDPSLPDYPLVFVNRAWTELTGYDESQLLGRNPRLLQGSGTDPDTVDRISEAIANEEPVTVEVRNYRRDGTPFWNELSIAPIHDDEGDLVHYVGFQNDVTERKRAAALADERAERIAEERRALDRLLGRVNGLLREITRILVEASDRETLARCVCREIASDPDYAGAWIGTLGPARRRIEVTAAGGSAPEPGVERSLEDTPRAVRQAVDGGDLREQPADGSAVGPFSPDAVGAARLVVVSLRHGRSRHGLLGVYVTGETDFDGRERTVLDSVGRMIANGIHVVETARILTTDRVVELCVVMRDGNDPLSRIAGALDATVDYRGITRRDGEYVLHLCTEDGGRDLSAVESLAMVSAVYPLADGKGPRSFAVETADEAPFPGVSEHGAVVASATAEPGRTRLTIEAPPEGDVGRVLDALRSRFGSVKLRSRIERDRGDRNLSELIGEVDEGLTERQRTALEIATRNGYFDWPRPVDGSELAETMGITRQTFHQHLRAAQRELSNAYIDP